MYLCNFETFSPPRTIDQKSLLEWIAKAHEAAISQQHSFNASLNIREKLFHVGLGHGKIEERATCLEDCSHEDFSNMQVYNLSHSIQGSGFDAKMQAFENIADQAFNAFYERPEELPNHLVHVTCTGYISPSAAQKTVSKYDKGNNCVVTHAYHMGCYAAFPALRMAQGFSQEGCVDIVHTEACTLHMDPSTHTYEQLVIQSLFADGFVKYRCLNKPPQKPALRLLALHEQLLSGTEQEMRWACSNHGLKMSLSKNIPVHIRRFLPEFLRSLLSKAGYEDSAIGQAIMAIHPGGTKIIGQIADLLQLRAEQYVHSQEVFKKRGNMSSATLPHIWKDILHDETVKEGSLIISCAFGPGLTISGSVAIKGGL